MKRLTLVLVLLIGVLLLQAAMDLPNWSDPASPASLHLSAHYLEKGLEETGVPNIVTAVLADYRSYDTLFEAVVVFAAGLIVLTLLRRTPRRRPKLVLPRPQRESQDIVLQGAARLLIPAIQVFALYVVAHGHYSPGGGFQGGVIFGASFILLAVCYDLQTALARFQEHIVLVCCAAGVLLYAGVGALCMALGWNFLGYAALAGMLGSTEVMARSHGILAVEIGVGITVMAIMVSLYIDLASGGDLDEGL